MKQSKNKDNTEQQQKQNNNENKTEKKTETKIKTTHIDMLNVIKPLAFVTEMVFAVCG